MSGLHIVKKKTEKGFEQNGPLCIFSGKQREISLAADQVKCINVPWNLFQNRQEWVRKQSNQLGLGFFGVLFG